MSSNDSEMASGCVGVIVGGLVVAWVLGSLLYDYDERWQQRLVNEGVAEYYLDEDNERQWRLIGEGEE